MVADRWMGPANLAVLDAEMIEVPAHYRSANALRSMMINVDLPRAVQASQATIDLTTEFLTTGRLP